MVGLSELKRKLAEIGFNRICSDGSAAEIEAMLQAIYDSQVELLKIEDQIEDQRRDALAAGDDDKVPEVEKQQDDLRRELDRVSAQLERGKARLAEVKVAEAKAELDAKYAKGQEATAIGLKHYDRYEEMCRELRDRVLPGIADTEREIREINTALREANDPRRVRLPVGVLVDKRGGDGGNRLDVTGATRLPAVVGAHHFWPRPR